MSHRAIGPCARTCAFVCARVCACVCARTHECLCVSVGVGVCVCACLRVPLFAHERARRSCEQRWRRCRRQSMSPPALAAIRPHPLSLLGVPSLVGTLCLPREYSAGPRCRPPSPPQPYSGYPLWLVLCAYPVSTRQALAAVRLPPPRFPSPH